jgi:MoaA/NifB/PqqE/SkfB family radical SAM enzyme
MDVSDLPETPGLNLARARKQILADTVMGIKKAIEKGKDWDAYVLASSITELEEVLYLSNQLDAKERNIIKTYQAAERKT